MNLSIFNNPGRRGYELHINQPGSHEILVASRIEFVDANVYDFTPPVAMLTAQECGDLMDSLWNAGIRPSNGEGSTGQLHATERHLEDMRSIVASKLNIGFGATK